MELLDRLWRMFRDLWRRHTETYARLYAKGYARRGMRRSFGEHRTVLRAMPEHGLGLGRLVRMVGLRQKQPETAHAPMHFGTLYGAGSRDGRLLRDQQNR